MKRMFMRQGRSQQGQAELGERAGKPTVNYVR